MKQLTKLFNIEPWTVINKKNDIQTLWPAYVLDMENIYLNERQKTSFEARREMLVSGKSILKNISTEKTSNIDFQSRLVFSTCSMSDEHNYSVLLRDLDIKNINLECIDYSIRTEQQTLKERLLQCGKIKLINKFEKTKKINTELSQVIACIPNKAYLISNKKAFLKQYLNNLSDEINYTSLIEEVISTKNRKYTNALYDIKCYLPLKKEYLDAPKSYWKDVKANSLHFIDINEYNSSSSASHKSFSNLIDWISDKNVDWSKKTNSGNYLITDTIIVAMQLSNEVTINDLSSEKGGLFNSYKKLSHFEKAEILVEIKKEWPKIWDFANSNRHKQDILNTPYKKSSNVFNFMKSFMDEFLNDNVKIEPTFFDDKWENIKKDLEPYIEHNDSAKKFLILANAVELNLTLITPEYKKINKPVKL
jgi:hypothetical protein